MFKARDKVVLRSMEGEVVGVDGQRVRVAWDDGLTSSVRSDSLRFRESDPEWAHVAALADVTAERDRARDVAVRLEQELSRHYVRVEAAAVGFRGVCSCGWRSLFVLSDRRDAAAAAMVHGMEVWS